jgi:hypothetical protein
METSLNWIENRKSVMISRLDISNRVTLETKYGSLLKLWKRRTGITLS